MNEFKKILIDCLVAPVLKLKETHPEYSFTEKGYETLVDNAIEEICRAILKMKEKSTPKVPLVYITIWNGVIDDVAKSIKGETQDEEA